MRRGFDNRSFVLLLLLEGTALYCCFGFRLPQRPTTAHRYHSRERTSVILSVLTEDIERTVDRFDMSDDIFNRKFLIHWRGEKDPGYSKSFRHLEFESAIAAELGAQKLSTPSSSILDDSGSKETKDEEKIVPNVNYTNALNYIGDESMTDMNIEHFNEANQFVSFSSDDSNSLAISKQTIIRAVERCSLIHGFYEIVAASETLDDLSDLAIEDGGFSDLYEGGANEKATWCFRARMYNSSEIPEENSNKGRGKRYSSRTRSMKIERDGLNALKDLMTRFGGKVNLEDPDCKIYIFDGLEDEIDGVRVGQKVLARRIASGPKIFSIAPAERICITNTPLEPIAAFVLCNIARIKACDKILDPYAGSCTTLLAAAMIAPDSETVGIEIAHNGLVNREHIVEDFTSRNLKLPNQIIHGDSTDVSIRETAKEAVNDEPFDAIIADPPYGIRESIGYNENSPLEELFTSIAIDSNTTDRKRLLKVGGRLIAFVPVTDEQTLSEMLPNQDLTGKAGLEFEVCREQPLNDKLSRWLVSFVSIK
mmetsp:Transcript_8633/g.18651  ORF Transcript_8633/g.18651 Transcript_8633/m.18651 type:complete len:537 (+) Transcript_8633:139-1749(+)|eukprot:CAMPEP_0168176186 /NCGR_PEP_ID=MMETSP0139_2-20121125/7615_1 /TAXON_ID=44445 /ORGANISM="Pseudo-nitzschia australis, Strain 10249 10 AB" /LENGTH=536 /DNA_ID=CAMNT_0008094811 /DNA_START=76 /DNA_END=1689 /DNA_ORIENTATION=-